MTKLNKNQIKFLLMNIFLIINLFIFSIGFIAWVVTTIIAIKYALEYSYVTTTEVFYWWVHKKYWLSLLGVIGGYLGFWVIYVIDRHSTNKRFQ